MRTKILACCAVLGVVWAVSCGTSSDGTGDNGGNGGNSGGSKGGGSAGKSSGGSGGSASGGSASGGSGSGGSGSGGSGGGSVGGMAGMAAGGAGGVKVACSVLPGAKKVDFEADADLWVASSDITKADNLRVPAPMPTLTSAQKHGDTGKSMALVVNTADGISKPSTDAGTDAGGDAGSGAASVVRNQWFFMFQNGLDWAKYVQAGRTISAWVLVPVGHKFVQFAIGSLSNAGWKMNDGALTTAVPGTWTKVSMTLPEDYDCSKVMYWYEMGLYMSIPAGQTWSGTVYVDDFEFSAKP